LASLATKQTARKAPSLRVAAKCGACFIALLGIVVQTTTFVARLAFIRILSATQSAWDLFRGSLARDEPFARLEVDRAQRAHPGLRCTNPPDRHSPPRHIVPAVVRLGMVTPAAHMFAFYFAILSAIMPE